MTDPLDRIAAALERLAPAPPPPADLTAHPAYHWRKGVIIPADRFAPLPLALLRGIEAQKVALLANTQRLAAGFAAHDVLLWGARGGGKSALVKSVVASVQAEGAALALVEIDAESLASLPDLFVRLSRAARCFLVFIDDLGFDGAGQSRMLRAVIEGGAQARPENVRLVVTSNRRHLLPRDLAEQDSAINPGDAANDALALADRFGLSLGFHAIDQDAYLDIVTGYAAAYGLVVDLADAIGWATRRGNRSGRVAWQYIVDLAGRSGVNLGA